MKNGALDSSADGDDPDGPSQRRVRGEPRATVTSPVTSPDTRVDSGTASTDHSYFTSMYAGAADPWGFDDSWYEQRKYDVTMAALPRRRYRRAVEPGCSNPAVRTER